jgi:NAD(P)-dependent dehydrogenase (short-subunit alcohol dehydrogenase family)
LIEWQEGDSEEFKNRQLKMIPLGRVGKSEEIVGAVRFLIENDYITGAEINIDGGRSL